MSKTINKWAQVCGTVLVLFGCATPGTASDWVYMGGTSSMYSFVDMQSVKAIPGGRLAAWVELLPIASVKSYESSHKKQLINAASLGYIAGYKSRFLQIPSIHNRYTPNELKNENVVIDIRELIASKGLVKPVGMVEYGFNCRKGLISILETVSYDPHDRPIDRSRAPEWMAVPSDTNGQWLSSVVCKSTHSAM